MQRMLIIFPDVHRETLPSVAPHSESDLQKLHVVDITLPVLRRDNLKFDSFHFLS